jgi:hypothetical protein
MYMTVPTFHEWRCHGSGIVTKKKLMNANALNTWFDAGILARCCHQQCKVEAEER